mmetsp:Transcript_13172/g.23889  ORF Transcript_13172/g.23889 Transcript_13172/m.23889 type:complete len:383 (-) Transcript_13172:47-1195(-)
MSSPERQPEASLHGGDDDQSQWSKEEISISKENEGESLATRRGQLSLSIRPATTDDNMHVSFDREAVANAATMITPANAILSTGTTSANQHDFVTPSTVASSLSTRNMPTTGSSSATSTARSSSSPMDIWHFSQFAQEGYGREPKSQPTTPQASKESTSLHPTDETEGFSDRPYTDAQKPSSPQKSPRRRQSHKVLESTKQTPRPPSGSPREERTFISPRPEASLAEQGDSTTASKISSPRQRQKNSTPSRSPSPTCQLVKLSSRKMRKDMGPPLSEFFPAAVMLGPHVDLDLRMLPRNLRPLPGALLMGQSRGSDPYGEAHEQQEPPSSPMLSHGVATIQSKRRRPPAEQESQQPVSTKQRREKDVDKENMANETWNWKDT